MGEGPVGLGGQRRVSALSVKGYDTIEQVLPSFEWSRERE